MTTKPYDARTLRMVRRELLAKHRARYSDSFGDAAAEVANFIKRWLSAEIDRATKAAKRKRVTR